MLVLVWYEWFDQEDTKMLADVSGPGDVYPRFEAWIAEHREKVTSEILRSFRPKVRASLPVVEARLRSEPKILRYLPENGQEFLWN